MSLTEPSPSRRDGWAVDTMDESGIPKLDEELISCLQTVSKHFIEMQGEASIVDVFMFLEQSDAVREVKFGPEDIMYICNTLLFDCTVESLLDDEIGDAYKIADQQRSGGNPTSKAHTWSRFVQHVGANGMTKNECRRWRSWCVPTSLTRSATWCTE